MARIVHLACSRCGHPGMVVVPSTENDDAAADIERASDRDRVTAEDDLAAAVRLRRLESLPTSLPVGGIITPV
ncbi:MAG TPA: hypothetical protein VGM11_02665 [Acidobacteriaceae bacterium]